jgi:hypothetical protein
MLLFITWSGMGDDQVMIVIYIYLVYNLLVILQA